MESMSGTDWTDEKHSLYLKSMEASFVNQLYDSKEMLGWHSPNSTTTPSGQFKVLRGGCWQKVNFRRNNSEINRSNECHDLKVNPWIQHFRSSTKHRATANALPTFEDSTTCTSQMDDLSGRKEILSASETVSMRESHMCRQDMMCSDTEMSDQNFVDEEVEGENENNKRNTKRKKSSITRNDQLQDQSKSERLQLFQGTPSSGSKARRLKRIGIGGNSTSYS
ncbi:hypothetical protein L6164_015444 [Bauhinia variegata]|uniref:Uncharacterized protein n=1 Tax=Bauhinia variegata TaxID=167791 RepID=A0ACB9NMN2_BAUVA|nr:hypothetical protein L6164_015444 [Bauhinia variegata]